MKYTSLKENKSEPAPSSRSAQSHAGRHIFQLKNNRTGSPEGKSAAQKYFSDNRNRSAIQKIENNTGLPDKLKSGIENLSGHSMDDVKVHYNSAQPAQLNAHAYAQGTDIHIAAGQEKHLPHEAWHVVQQKQGRVKPVMQMKGKVNINNDKELEKEADMMGERSMQFKIQDKESPIPENTGRAITKGSIKIPQSFIQLKNRKTPQLRSNGIGADIIQLKPSERLEQMKRFIENRTGIINSLGASPTRLRLLEYDRHELQKLQEPDRDGQELQKELLEKVERYIGLVTPEAGLVPHTAEQQKNFDKLKETFIKKSPKKPTREQLSAGPEAAKEYAEVLGKFQLELNAVANPLGFKVLARFFVEGEGEHIVHPGINSWARFNAFKPESAIPLRPIPAGEIKDLAKKHMTLGHDTGEEHVDVIKNSPLISGSEDIGALIIADSRFAAGRMSGLMGAPSPKKNPIRKNILSSKFDAPSSSGAGKGASDRIIKLIWGFDHALQAKNLNSRTPVAVANTLMFIAVPLDYEHLYTPQQIKADKSDCCTLEKENTVFAQLTNIKTLAIGSLPNYFPYMQIHDDATMERRSEYIELLRSGILNPNSYVNLSKRNEADQQKFILALEEKIERQKRR